MQKKTKKKHKKGCLKRGKQNLKFFGRKKNACYRSVCVRRTPVDGGLRTRTRTYSGFFFFFVPTIYYAPKVTRGRRTAGRAENENEKCK